MQLRLLTQLTQSMCFSADSEEYLEAVKKTPYMTLEDLQEFTLQYGDVYFHPVSPKPNYSYFYLTFVHSVVVGMISRHWWWK